MSLFIITAQHGRGMVIFQCITCGPTQWGLSGLSLCVASYVELNRWGSFREILKHILPVLLRIVMLDSEISSAIDK